MPETSFSLLEQIRLRPDSAAWSRLVHLYTPLIHLWLHRYGVPVHDADDLTQEVLAAVVRDLPEFSHDLRRGALRRWLRTITVNRLRNYWRGRDHRPVVVGGSAFDEALAQLEDPESRLSAIWDEEHDRHVLGQLMELIRPDFEPATWNAFQRLVVDGLRSADVAAELNLSVNAVRIAKSRVLRRLRQEMESLIAS
jgi:RNA polymerase sigma-70 factor (ECF subfamily)